MKSIFEYLMTYLYQIATNSALCFNFALRNKSPIWAVFSSEQEAIMVFGLFKKKSKENTTDVKSNDSYLSLPIKEVVQETKDAVSIFFDVQNQNFDYKAGQFITIIDTINGEKLRRAYSLCTSPHVDTTPGVTVKRVSGGKMSNHINEAYKAGQTIEIMKPMGLFTPVFNTSNNRHVILFGGGSGITPLMSILKSTLSQEPNSVVSLVYANETENDIIFSKAITQLEAEHGERLKVVHVLNKPANDSQKHKGWLSASTIMAVLEELPKHSEPNTFYFTCGPAPMMDAVINTLKTMAVPESNVFMESFEAGKTAVIPEIKEANESSVVKVKVDHEGETFEFEVSPKKTILEAGLDKKIDLPYSCQSGLCTACRGKLISGKVRMIEYDGLSQQEIEDGYVLCCQAHPETDDVHIEIG
jgi:ring-1,2-phenylacetyl-CoA epoxidase subunit PaaE